MISGTACHDVDLLHRPQFLIRHVQFFNHKVVVLDPRRDCVGNGLRLLIDFLEHEVLIARLLRRLGIPVNHDRLLRHLFLIHGEEAQSVPAQSRNLLIFHIIHLPGIFQDRRNVGCDK